MNLVVPMAVFVSLFIIFAWVSMVMYTERLRSEFETKFNRLNIEVEVLKALRRDK